MANYSTWFSQDTEVECFLFSSTGKQIALTKGMEWKRDYASFPSMPDGITSNHGMCAPPMSHEFRQNFSAKNLKDSTYWLVTIEKKKAVARLTRLTKSKGHFKEEYFSVRRPLSKTEEKELESLELPDAVKKILSGH